jgi:hypothetical protein
VERSKVASIPTARRSAAQGNGAPVCQKTSKKSLSISFEFRAHLHKSASDSEAVYLRESMYTRFTRVHVHTSVLLTLSEAVYLK